MSCAGLFFFVLFWILGQKFLYLYYRDFKILPNMKRLTLLLVAMLVVCTGYAQQPDRALLEAKIAYDEAVLAQKRAVTDMRNEERRISDAAERRVEESKENLATVKQNYKATVAEQKQLVAAAKLELKSATLSYKEESARAKQEVAAAKANTKSVIAERKSDVARAKAEIERVKAESHL